MSSSFVLDFYMLWLDIYVKLREECRLCIFENTVPSKVFEYAVIHRLTKIISSGIIFVSRYLR